MRKEIFANDELKEAKEIIREENGNKKEKERERKQNKSNQKKKEKREHIN